MEIGAGGGGEHDPGPVIVLEHDGPLQRARGEHNRLCPHLPESPFRKSPPLGHGDAASDSLDQDHSVLIERDGGGGSGENARPGRRPEQVCRIRYPFRGGAPLNERTLSKQGAA